MTERLAQRPGAHESLDHTPDVDPELVRQINSIEVTDDRQSFVAEKLQAVTGRVRAFLERRALNKAHGEALKEDTQRQVEAQNAAYDTYANNIAYTSEKERLIDPRSRLRKIGDWALRTNEKLGKSGPAKWMARVGLIPPIGTRHNQRGFNFSAWAARKYVKAQEARKSREKRISAGFLSPEDQAYLNSIDETTPEKIAQDEAYQTYQENLDATVKKELQEQKQKEAQDTAYETYQENIDATAQREAREAQDKAYDSYTDNITTTASREQAEREAQREAFDSYAENIGATAKRELQEATYETYADNIDATARRESQETAFESYETNIDATAARERREAHERATRASDDRSERRERRPIRERAANLKDRFSRLRGRVGASAMKLFRRAKSGIGSATNFLRRRR